MKIAEFFFQLGLKGDKDVSAGLKKAKQGLEGVRSTSLETKAAILGVVYGLERMMSWSANLGTSLGKFNQLTNISAESLQRWQYAGRQFGVSAQSVESSMMGVQQAMGDMLIGKGAPEGMAMLADSVGFDMEKAQDTLYVMQKLQEFAVKNKGNATLSNSVLRSFGLNDDMIQGMKQMAFTKERMAKADIFSNKEVGVLAGISTQWANLENKAQMLFGRLTIAFGPETIKGISSVADQVFKMVWAFAELAKKIEIIKTIGMVFEGWMYIFQALTFVVSDLLPKLMDFVSKLPNFKMGKWLLDKAGDFIGGAADHVGTSAALSESPMAQKWLMNNVGGKPNQVDLGRGSNIEIKQELNFNHDGRDAVKTKESVKSATEQAYRQMSAQRQAN